jgi:hypothetical protein
VAVAAVPALDGAVELSPAAEVEVSDAEIGPVGDLQRLAQGVEERLLDVIEDTGHSDRSPRGTRSKQVGCGRESTCPPFGLVGRHAPRLRGILRPGPGACNTPGLRTRAVGLMSMGVTLAQLPAWVAALVWPPKELPFGRAYYVGIGSMAGSAGCTSS